MYDVFGVKISHARKQLIHHVFDLRELEHVVAHEQSGQVVLKIVHNDQSGTLEAIPFASYLLYVLRFLSPKT